MRVWLTVSLLFLLIAAVVDGVWESGYSGNRQPGVFSTDPPSPYFHYTPRGASHGKILVVHGLDANKEMMNLLCLGLSDAGFEVYSMDLPGHGDSAAGFNGMLARQAVSAALNVLGPGTAVIGHSLGGALLLDLANDRPFGSMVLLSPAPTEIDRIHADRLLVVTGQFDLPRIPAFVPQIEDAVTGSIEMRTIPWAGHSGYLLQPGPIRMIATWLGGDPSSLRTGHRLMRIFGEILCVIVMAAIWLPGKPILPAPGHTPTKLVWYIASCALATLISGFVTVLPMLHLFSTDYLIGFVLAVGLALIPAWACRMSIRFSQILVSLFAAAAVIAIASTVGSELVHLTLSEGRWWRFGIIAAAVLPLSLADEILLRPIRPWWRAAGAAALTRILLAAFVITGVLTLNRSDAFLVLVIHFVVLFWIALWFAGEWLRRQTQDPLATAIFIALVQAWVFAAIFVVI